MGKRITGYSGYIVVIKWLYSGYIVVIIPIIVIIYGKNNGVITYYTNKISGWWLTYPSEK